VTGHCTVHFVTWYSWSTSLLLLLLLLILVLFDVSTSYLLYYGRSMPHWVSCVGLCYPILNSFLRLYITSSVLGLNIPFSTLSPSTFKLHSFFTVRDLVPSHPCIVYIRCVVIWWTYSDLRYSHQLRRPHELCEGWGCHGCN
jgi:hypothetical protein